MTEQKKTERAREPFTTEEVLLQAMAFGLLMTILYLVINIRHRVIAIEQQIERQAVNVDAHH